MDEKNTVSQATMKYIISLGKQSLIQEKMIETQKELINSLQEENNQLKALIEEYLLQAGQNMK